MGANGQGEKAYVFGMWREATGTWILRNGSGHGIALRIHP